VPTPYRGVFALVDLGRREVRRLEVPGSLYQQFIGGASIAAALFSELAASEPEPPSPENPLIFATGPLTGTRAPTSGRYAVAARPPPTGLWGEATSGGRFGPQLKFAGFDGLVLVGAAERPVYLCVSDGRVELRDAAHLWGPGTCETMRLVREETDGRASAQAAPSPFRQRFEQRPVGRLVVVLERGAVLLLFGEQRLPRG
jgi:aldehyde:ferredoxin oxidoreductase